MKSFGCFFVFLFPFESFSSYFSRVMKGVVWTIPEEQEFIFILPFKENILSFKNLSHQTIFRFNNCCKVLSISTGKVVNLKNKEIEVEFIKDGKKIIVKYIGMQKILVIKGQKVDAGDVLGIAKERLCIQVKVNDIPINFLNYVNFDSYV